MRKTAVPSIARILALVMIIMQLTVAFAFTTSASTVSDGSGIQIINVSTDSDEDTDAEADTEEEEEYVLVVDESYLPLVALCIVIGVGFFVAAFIMPKRREKRRQEQAPWTNKKDLY